MNRTVSYSLAVLFATVGTVMFTASVEAQTVDSFGVMWSRQNIDTNGGVTENFQSSGGRVNGMTYVASWQHSNTFPASASGGRGLFIAGYDDFGNLSSNFLALHPQLEDDNTIGPGLGGQAYGFGVSIHDAGGGQTNVVGAGSMQNLTTDYSDYSTPIVGQFSPAIKSITDIEGSNTLAFRDQSVVAAGGFVGWAYSAEQDSSGNVYMAGLAQQGFDGIAYTGVGGTGTSDDRDPFIVKYDSAGNIVAGLIDPLDSPGSVKQQNNTAIVVDDATGDIYVAGRTNGDTTGNGYAGGTYDTYVAKYTVAGSVITRAWNIELESANYDLVMGLTLDGAGNLYAAGEFNDAASLHKLSTADGSTVWSSIIGTEGRGFKATIDADGDVWLAAGVSDDLADEEGNGVIGRDNVLVEHDAATGAVKTLHQFGPDDSLAVPADVGPTNDNAQTVDVEAGGQVFFVSGHMQGEYPDWQRVAETSTDHNDSSAYALKYTAGDLTGDNLVNVDDLDDVNQNLFAGTPNYADFDGDSDFDQDDMDRFVQVIFQTNYGDNDLDGDIDTSDITTSTINFTGAGGAGKGWADGDTNGDGDVDTSDVTTSVINFTGALAGAPGVPDLWYDPATGNITIDTDGLGDLGALDLQSAGGLFTGDPTDFSGLPAGATDDLDGQIGWVQPFAAGVTGVFDLGNVMQAGLTEAQFLADLAGSQYGIALGAGGGGGQIELFYGPYTAIPEPSSMVLLGLAGCMAVVGLRRRAA